MNIDMLIGGTPTRSIDNEQFERKNPVSGEVVTTAPAAKSADVDRAVKAAASAFKTWSKTGPSERRAILLKVA